MENTIVVNNNFNADGTIMLSGGEFPIISAAESNDARSQYEVAKTFLNELIIFKSAVTDAKTLLMSGESCTAVDKLIAITIQPPKSGLAIEFYEQAKKLQQESMLLCAEKLAKLGGYDKARTILQPYADENERFRQEIEKIVNRQNQEMDEKARQKKDVMDDIKREDRRWSTIGISASILGGLLLVAGVISAFLGQVPAGIISFVSSILPGLVVALYYNRSDKIRAERLKLIEKTASEAQLDLDAVKKATGLSKS